ncbi:polysaccharide biosynthesis C-terminal domain-containing protein [Ruminococcaceae bacterium OttesenSCG-928-L11]|nr:polysaccharide biosynthesis C-terminal domain-containing protein [Ruminococcaceae bacterium OttesenSCG-928-L11]
MKQGNGRLQGRENSMVTGALILSASALFVRMIGFVFRIYLSNAMGAEGMGVHMLIMSMYNVCVTLATSGMATAMSRLAAEQLSLGSRANARRILKRACVLALLISCTVSVAVIALAEPIGTVILKDGRTVMALRILGLGLPFLSVSACLRGYFVSSRKAGNPAAGQVIEQLVKMAFIMGLIGKYLPMGIEYGCVIVVLGMTIGEIACFLFSFWGILRERKYGARGERATVTGVNSMILAIIVPLSVTAYVRSFLRLAEDVLIMSGFKAFYGQDGMATGTYGMVKGMVMPLLTFPLMLLSSFVITLTPEISRMNAAGNTRRLEATISRILEYTFIAGVLIVAVFMTFPYEIGTAVYKNAEVGEMLRRLSFLCPFMCVEMVAVGILNGLGQQVSTMKYAIADSLVRIAVIYFLIPQQGITGFVVMVVISNLLTSLLNFRRLMHIASVRLRLRSWVLRPALAAGASSQIVKVFTNYFPMSDVPLWGRLAVGIGLVCALYCVALFALGSFRLRDFQWIWSRLKTSSKTPVATADKSV